MSATETLKKIRTRFLFDHPFLSVLALSLTTTYRSNKEAPIETDGAAVFIDEEKLADYPEEELRYLYAHVLLHVVFKHPHRKQWREEKLWNIATDLTVNLLLDEMKNVGSRPEAEAFHLRFKDQSAEEIYEELEKLMAEREDPCEKPGIKDLNDSGELTVEATEELDALIVQALSVARNASGMPAAFYDMVDEAIKPEIPFEEALKEYLTQTFFERQMSFLRPNRRYVARGIYLPGNVPPDQRLEIVVAVDGSASIDPETFKRFLGAVESLVDSFYEFKITVAPFDTKVHEEAVESFESMAGLERRCLNLPKGDGGTDFTCVQRWAAEQTFSPGTVMMVLTDGHFPLGRGMEMETLFFVTEKKNVEKLEPFGKTMVLR